MEFGIEPSLITLTGDYDDNDIEYMGRRRRGRKAFFARAQARRAKRKRRRRKMGRTAGLMALGPIGRIIALRRLRKKRRAAGKPVGIRARIKARRAKGGRRGKRLRKVSRIFLGPVARLIAMRRRRKRRRAQGLPVGVRARMAARRQRRMAGDTLSGKRGDRLRRFLARLSFSTKEGDVKYTPGKGLTLTSPTIPAQKGIFTQSDAMGKIFNKKNMIPIAIGGSVIFYIFSQRNKGIN